MHTTPPLTMLVLAACAGLTHAQTYTVTTLNDVSDAGGGTLPGPDGKVSMREAVTAANATPGPQTIEFAIPETEFWLVDGVALLRLEHGAWELTDDETTIDFASQAVNIGDTNPNGMEVGVYGLEPNAWGVAAIYIHSDHCTIKGMGQVHQRGASVRIRGNHNRVIGCVTGGVTIDGGWQSPPATFNIIGGTEPGEGNDMNGMSITSWADDNIVIGNRLDHVSVTGGSASTYPKRNRIGGPTESERNVINNFGSYGHEGFPTGSGIRVEYAEDTLIEGNYIGVTADGMSRVVQRGIAGIEVADAVNTTIRNNLIAGVRVVGTNHAAGQIFGTAIRINAINGDNHGTTIVGNLIGTDATGQNPITTRAGITIAPTTAQHAPMDTVIGGENPEDANTIAFTELAGVSISSLVEGVSILGNSIHSNQGLGIDLFTSSGLPGSNANDPFDNDSGGNGLQNFPVLDTAESGVSSTRVVGSLDSAPSTSYTIEFFASPECDPSGYGEGQLFLGRTSVTTDSGGSAAFDATLPTSTPHAWVVTATATETATGNTSEFSLCLSATGITCVADLTGDGMLDFFDVSAFLNAYNAMDPAADLTGDGGFDFFDVSAFLNAYNAGCP